MEKHDRYISVSRTKSMNKTTEKFRHLLAKYFRTSNIFIGSLFWFQSCHSVKSIFIVLLKTVRYTYVHTYICK